MVLQQDICFSCKLDGKLSCGAEDKSKYWRYSMICIVLHSIQDWFNCRKLFINPFWINWLNKNIDQKEYLKVPFHEWILPEKLHFCLFQFWPWQEHLYLLVYSSISEEFDDFCDKLITCFDSSGRDMTQLYHEMESIKTQNNRSQATWTIYLCL